MWIFVAACFLIGIFPGLLYPYLPYPVDYVPYTAGKVLFYLQLLLFSGLAFFLLLPLMKRTETISLDADWLWRVAFYNIARGSSAVLSTLGDRLSAMTRATSSRLQSLAIRHFSTTDSEEKSGVFARTWAIGGTALWIAVLLTTYVLVYYF